MDEEIEEVENFFGYFGEELASGKSPEWAYRKALQKYDGSLKNLFYFGDKLIFEYKFSFEEVINRIMSCLSCEQSRIMFNLIIDFLKKDTKKSGYEIISITKVLKINRLLLLKRKKKLSTISFKINSMILSASAVLGFISALAPIFSMYYLLKGGNIMLTGTYYGAQHFLPSLITFSMINILTASEFSKIITEKKMQGIIFLSSGIYLATYFWVTLFLLPPPFKWI